MKKYVYCCAIFCIAVCAYPQELPQADGNEAVQSETVMEGTASESVKQEIVPEAVMQEATPEIAPAKITEVQAIMGKSRIDGLIKDGLFKNKTLISQQALQLTEAQRLNLQEQHKLGYVKPLLFNCLLGFGIGNFINKDRIGGITHVVIDSLAVGTIVIAGSIYAGEALVYLFLLPVLLLGQDDKQVSDTCSSIEKTMKSCEIIVQASFGVFLANKLASIISVSVHTAKYNKTLKEVLTPAGAQVSVQAAPIIAPNQFGLALSINY